MTNQVKDDELRAAFNSDVATLISKMAEYGNSLKDKLDSLYTTTGKDLQFNSPVSETLVRDISSRTSCIESEIRRLENQLSLLEETLKIGEVPESTRKPKRKLSSEELTAKLEALKKEKCDLEEEKKEWLKEVRFLKCQLQYREEVKQLQNGQRKDPENNFEDENKKLKEEINELKRRLMKNQEKQGESSLLTKALDLEQSGSFHPENELFQLRRERKMLLSTIMKLQDEKSETKTNDNTNDASTQCHLGIASTNWLPEFKNNQHTHFENQLDLLRKELKELEDENHVLDDENTRLVEEKRNQEDTIHKLKGQLTDALDSSIDEIEQLNGLRLTLEKKLEFSNKQNEHLLKLLEKLKDENCSLLDSVLDDIEQKESLDDAIDFVMSEVDKIIQINKSRKYSFSGPEEVLTLNKHELTERGFLLTEMKSCKNLIEDQRYQIRKLQIQKRDIEENYVKLKRELVIIKASNQKASQIHTKGAAKTLLERKLSDSAMNVDIMETVDERSENVYEENEILQNDNYSLRREINFLNSKLRELELLVKKLKEEECTLEEEKACLLSSLFNQVERCDALEKQIEGLEKTSEENKLDENQNKEFKENCCDTVQSNEATEKLTFDAKHLSEEVENLQQFVQELENEKRQLQESFKTSQNRVHELQQECLILKGKVQKSNALGETLHECLREAHDEKQELTDNLEEILEEKNELENQKTALGFQLSERTNELKQIHDTLDSLKNKNVEIYKERDEMEAQLRFLYVKLVTLAGSFDKEDDREKILNQMTSDELRNDKDFTKMGEISNIIVEKIVNELVGFQKVKSDHLQINNKLERTLKEKASFQNLVRETEEKRRQMKSFLTRLTDEKEVINEQLDEVKQQKKNLAEALENVYQSKEALQDALDSALLKQQQTSQALYEAINDNKALRDSLYRVAEERDAIRDGLATSRKDFELLTESELKYKDRARGLQEEVDKLDEETSVLRESQRRNEKEQEEMKQLVANLIKERNELAGKIEDFLNWEQVMKTNLAKAALENDEAIAEASEFKFSAEVLAEENLQLRKHLQQFLDNYNGSSYSEEPAAESPTYCGKEMESTEEIRSSNMEVSVGQKPYFDSFSKEKQNEAMKKHFPNFYTENLKLKALLQLVTNRKQILEDKLEQMSIKNIDLQNMLKSKGDALDAVQANYERVCKDIDVLKVSYEDAIVDKQKIKVELSDLSSEKEKLRSELNEKTTERHIFNCDLEEEKNEFLNKLERTSEEVQDKSREFIKHIDKAEKESLNSTIVQNPLNDEFLKLPKQMSLEYQVQSLSSENENLRNEIEKLTKKNRNMDEKIDKLSEENNKLSREVEITALMIENLIHTTNLECLKNGSEQQHCEFANLNEKVSFGSCSRLERILEMESENVSRHLKNLHQLNKSLTQLKMDFTEMKERNNQLSQNLTALKTSNIETENQLEISLQEKNPFKENVNKLSEKEQQILDITREEHEQLADIMKHAVKRSILLKEEVKQERQEMGEVIALCDILKSDLEHWDNDLKDCIVVPSKEDLSTEEKLSAIKQELKRRKQELDDKDILLQSLSDKISKSKENESKANDLCSQMSRTIEELKETESKLQKDLEDAVMHKGVLQGELEETTQKLNEASNEINGLKIESAVAKSLQDDLKSKVLNFDNFILETTQKLEKSQDIESTLSLTVGEQNKELNSLKLFLSELQKELEAVRNEKSLLQKDEKKLRSEMEESQNSFRSVIKEKQEIEQELGLLRVEKEMFLEGSKLIEKLEKEATETQLNSKQTREKLDKSNRSLKLAQDELTNYHKMLTELEHQKQEMEKSLNTFANETNELQYNLDQASKREIQLKKELESMKQQEEVNQKMAELRKKLDKEKIKVQNLESSVEQLKKENGTLKRRLDNKSEEKQRLEKSRKEIEDQRKRMEKVNKELEERIRLVQNEKRRTEEQLKKEKESRANLLCRLEEANEDKEELEEILEGLQNKKKKLQENLDRAILEKEAREEQLLAFQETLENQVADLSQKEGNVKKSLEVSEAEKNALSTEIKVKEQHLNEARIQIQVLRSELFKNKEQVEVYQSELKLQASSRKKDLENLRDLKDKLEEREKHFVETKSKFLAITEELNDNVQQVAVLRTKLKELRNSKVKMEKEIAEKEQISSVELSYLRNRENTLLKTLNERDKTIETLKTEITIKNRKAEELRERSNEEEIEKRDLEEKMQSILQEQKQLEKECKPLESENESLNQQLCDANDKINSLQNEFQKQFQQKEQSVLEPPLNEEIFATTNEEVTFAEIAETSEEVVGLQYESKFFQREPNNVDEGRDEIIDEKKPLKEKLMDSLREKEEVLKKLKCLEASQSILKKTTTDLISQTNELIDSVSSTNELDNLSSTKSTSREQQRNHQENDNTMDGLEDDQNVQLSQSFEKLKENLKLLATKLTENKKKGNLAEFLRNNNKLKAENDTLVERINAFNKNKVFQDRELVDLRNQNQKLLTQLESENRKIEHFEKSLQKSKESQKLLRESLNKMIQEAQGLREERRIAVEELDKMRMQRTTETGLQKHGFEYVTITQREKNELTDAKTSLEMKCKMLETTVKEKEDALNSKQQELSQLEALYKAMENSLGESVEERSKLVSDTYAFKIKLENEIHDLTSRLTKKDERVSELQKKYDLLMAQNNNLPRCEMKDLGNKLGETGNSKEGLEKHSNYLAEQNNENLKKIKELDIELKDRKELTRELERKVESLEQILNQHVDEEKKIVHEKEQLLKDLSKTRKKLIERELHMEELANIFQIREDEMQEKIARLTANTGSKTEEKENIQSSILQMKNEYSQLEDENNKLIESLAKVQEQNIELKKENILFRKACNQLRCKRASEEKLVLNKTEIKCDKIPTSTTSDVQEQIIYPESLSESSVSDVFVNESASHHKEPRPHVERTSPEGSEIPDSSQEKSRNLQPALVSLSNKNIDLESGASSDSGLMIRVASFVNSFQGEDESDKTSTKKTGGVPKSSIKLQTCVKEGRRRTQEVLSTDLILANEQVARRAAKEIVPVKVEISDQRRASNGPNSKCSARPGSAKTESNPVSSSLSEISGKPICTKNYCSPILSLVDACPLHKVLSTERTKGQCPVCKKDKKTGTRPKQLITLEKYV